MRAGSQAERVCRVEEPSQRRKVRQLPRLQIRDCVGNSHGYALGQGGADIDRVDVCREQPERRRHIRRPRRPTLGGAAVAQIHQHREVGLQQVGQQVAEGNPGAAAHSGRLLVGIM